MQRNLGRPNKGEDIQSPQSLIARAIGMVGRSLLFSPFTPLSKGPAWQPIPGFMGQDWSGTSHQRFGPYPNRVWGSPSFNYSTFYNPVEVPTLDAFQQSQAIAKPASGSPLTGNTSWPVNTILFPAQPKSGG